MIQSPRRTHLALYFAMLDLAESPGVTAPQLERVCELALALITDLAALDSEPATASPMSPDQSTIEPEARAGHVRPRLRYRFARPGKIAVNT